MKCVKAPFEIGQHLPHFTNGVESFSITTIVTATLVTNVCTARAWWHEIKRRGGRGGWMAEKIRNKTEIQMEKTKFNGLFILICRQQHFETFLFKWNGWLRTFMSMRLTIRSISNIFLLLFVEKKQQLLAGWKIRMYFFKSCEDTRANAKEAVQWWKFLTEKWY